MSEDGRSQLEALSPLPRSSRVQPLDQNRSSYLCVELTIFRTTITDSNGNYSFDHLNPGAYRVYFATTENLKSSGKIDTSLSTGTIAPGASASGLNAGFVTDPDTDKTNDIPKAVTQINVVIRG